MTPFPGSLFEKNPSPIILAKTTSEVCVTDEKFLTNMVESEDVFIYNKKLASLPVSPPPLSVPQVSVRKAGYLFISFLFGGYISIYPLLFHLLNDSRL